MGKINYPVLALAFIFSTITSGAALSQPQDKEAGKQSVIEASELERAVEKAIKNLERDKAFKEKQFINELKSKLNLAVEEWIFSQRQQRQAGLDKIVRQNWELLYPNPVTIVHYDYYLRDFIYSIGESDIIRTGSLVNPYKAYFKVSEILYVEREHISNVSYPELYLFKVTTPIEVMFDYRDGNFSAAEVKKDNIIFKQGWDKK